jgi:hypothetical protein
MKHVWWRRGVGGLWIVAWAVIVGSVHAPWLRLGGLVSETIRYWERIVLAYAAILGCFLGATARDLIERGARRTHASLLRTVVLVPAGVCALILCLLAYQGSQGTAGTQGTHEASGWIGVVFVGFLSYWAGFDIGIGAWPLTCGRHHSFTGPIRLEPEDVDRLGADPGDPFR